MLQLHTRQLRQRLFHGGRSAVEALVARARSRASSSSKVPLFYFWEPANSMHAYLQLCIETWSRRFSSFEIIPLSYANLHRYLDRNTYDSEQLRKLSLPQQADAIRAALLEQVAGAWFDCDTIALRDAKELLDRGEGREAVVFGNPEKGRFSINILLATRRRSAFFGQWREECQKRVRSMPSVRSWDYMGNAFLNAWVQQGRFSGDQLAILPWVDHGLFPEAVVLKKYGKGPYQEFWFGRDRPAESAFLGEHQFAIELHNAWTPKWYQAKPRGWLVAESRQLLSKTIRHALMV